MTMKQWYEALFANYANQYDRESFTQGTLQEVDFIEQELDFDKSRHILDVGCGTGRHAIELAKRGYAVTGVDLSAAQLRRAFEKAAAAGVTVTFLERDARELAFEAEFDTALMLCEGGFSLMETDEMNYRILTGIARALKTGGIFIMTALSALYPLYHCVDQFLNAEAGAARSSESVFDLATFRMTSLLEFTDDDGHKQSLRCNERYYAPSEMTWLLGSLGFRDVQVFGCMPGRFSRSHPVNPDDYEIMVIGIRG
jgi:ubiquinone/menaquinone biosynthesis C-methylase UbiE